MNSLIRKPRRPSPDEIPNPGYFHQFIEKQRRRQKLVVQPRMGFSDWRRMRHGLQAVKDHPAPTVGTITVDSFTRSGDLEGARRAVERSFALNGYPIVTSGARRNRRLIAGLHSPGFPIQVRHGTPRPGRLVQSLLAAGLEATEGGPVSYCLPYGRVSLAESLRAWDDGCRRLASFEERGTRPHLESFGGCLLGQLCPPALLVAVTLLEAIFFRRRGLSSLSLSYAQGTSSAQDVGALLALRQLAGELLAGARWHVVVYTWMGLFPLTPSGSRQLIEESARVAVAAGAERLIVKTASEAVQIPSIADNLEAIGWAQRAASAAPRAPGPEVDGHRQLIYAQARHLVAAVRDLSGSLSEAMARAFRRGYLDVPYCLHPDNRNRTRSWIDPRGVVHWAEYGDVPFPKALRDKIFCYHRPPSSEGFLRMLAFNRNLYDHRASASDDGVPGEET